MARVSERKREEDMRQGSIARGSKLVDGFTGSHDNRGARKETDRAGRTPRRQGKTKPWG
jgi:hypothetical protein